MNPNTWVQKTDEESSGLRWLPGNIEAGKRKDSKDQVLQARKWACSIA
ncbi:MAG TPA: hypothetical protein VHB01_08540 [Nitrosospira sp.]|nr:hypothetical protein [Nitrosospira sp.]